MIQSVTPLPNTNRHLHVNFASDYKRVHSQEASTAVKIASAIGAVAGSACSLALIAKKQNKAFYNIEYGLKEMLGVGLGAVGGGVLGGIIPAERKKFEKKLDEGIFQYSMIAIPGAAVAGVITACEKSKYLNNTPTKIIATLFGLAAGLLLSVEIANVVSDINNEEPDRKLKFKDAIASIDDFIGIFVLAKVKFVKKLKLERLIPLIYAYCGYKAGTTN